MQVTLVYIVISNYKSWIYSKEMDVAIKKACLSLKEKNTNEYSLREIKSKRNYAYPKVRSSSKRRENTRRLNICNGIFFVSGFLQHSLCCLDVKGNVRLWPLHSREIQMYSAKHI